MSSVCVPKLKFLYKRDQQLGYHTIRTNKNTKLAQVKYTGFPACILYKLFCQAKQILALTQTDTQTTQSVHEPTLTMCIYIYITYTRSTL